MGKCGTRLRSERLTGDAVGLQAWLKAQSYFEGKAR